MQARRIETPLGAMLALAGQDGLHLLEFVDRRGLENEITAIRARIKYPIVPGNNAHLEKIGEELQNYFEGREVRFTGPLIVGGSAFERDVWAKLQTIPPGQTWSYAELATKAGNPAAVRAAGAACAHNRVAPFVPCHRVVRTGGNLGGYYYGLPVKRWLLDHERGVTTAF